MKIHVKNGRLIDPKQNIDTVQDVYIAAGKILATGPAPEGFTPNRVINAKGLIVCPGLIDLAARLREPGYEYMATLESEMLAAVAGGVTSLVCPPDTDPPLDEPGLVEMLKYRAKNLNQARVYPLGALTQGLKGEHLTEMAELVDAGCVAFSHADAPLVDIQVLMNAMKYAATFRFGVWLRPQDPHLSQDTCAHEGEVTARLGLPAMPTCAETVALSTILLLAQETGVKLHLCRLSSAAGVEMVRVAKRHGMQLTCDVSANNVHLCDNDIGFFDTQCHLTPPLRGTEDRDAIRLGLLDGTIDAICSDHTPVNDDAKQLPFTSAESGATGLELLLPLMLKWEHETQAGLSLAISKVTQAPASILGIDSGNLAPGRAADICIFDPNHVWKIDASALKSQGKNTPFLGTALKGRVKYALVEGIVVYED